MASGFTPTYLIPYPLPTDPVNVASDMEEMADRLENLFTNTVQLSAANIFTNTNIFSVNSSSAAVRITQVGSGNAFLVEDDANPDTSAFVVTNAGDVGIGKLSPQEKVDVIGNIKLSGNLIFEGTDDTYELSFAYTDPTADRTITLPDVTGTVITNGNLTDITTVGTVIAGLWNASTIGANYGGTGISTYLTGDILYSSSTNVLSKLAIGTSGQVLRVSSGGIPEWATISVSAATPTVAGTVFGYTNAVGGNIGLGYSALGSQSASNDEHIAIGYEALSSITTAAFADIMIGYRSGYGLTTGDYNIGIGGFNFWGTTTGSYNIAIGYETLPAYAVGGLTSSHNIFIGHTSGYNAASTIVDNVSVGNGNLYAYQGAYTVAIGNGALAASTTGNENTAVGFYAGGAITTGAQNTLLGSRAANDGGGPNIELTTGSNNIIIGYESAPTSSSVSNEITIGNASNNRFRVPGLGIDWTPATVPSGSGGGASLSQVFMLMGA